MQSKLPKYIGSFKFHPKKGCYVKSNLKFYTDPCRGYSYEWYKIVKKIDDKVVLNTYPYSRTTRGHVDDIRYILRNLEIPVFMEIESPHGRLDLQDVSHHYTSMINDIREKISAKGSKQSLNELRMLKIVELESQLKKFTDLVNAEHLEQEINQLLSV